MDTIEKIKGEIQTIAIDFLYYDRKEDEDLSFDELKKAIVDGDVSLKQMAAWFHEELGLASRILHD